MIASLNGSTLGGWTEYAKQIEQAGADALELNIYWIPTDPEMEAGEVEARYVQIVEHVKGVVSIPVAVKLSPFFSSFAHMARRAGRGRCQRARTFQSFLSTGHRCGNTRCFAEYSA